MNTLSIPATNTSVQASASRINGSDIGTEVQKESVGYEYAGYQVRVHFDGDKTLMQCIQNLAERKTEG